LVRRPEFILILLVLLLAAFVRLADLARLPAGFSDAEIASLHIGETAKFGPVAIFYTESERRIGREAAFPLLETLVAGIFGNGLFAFRVLPLWCGLLTVALVYALARRLLAFPEALLAAVFTAFSVFTVVLSRVIVPQTLLLPIYLGALLALTQGLHLRDEIRPLSPTTSPFTVFALLFGIGVYVHYSGLILLLLVALFWIYLRATVQPISRRVYSHALFAFVAAFTLMLPYILSTLRVPQWSGLGAIWKARPETFWALFENTLNLLRYALSFGVLGVFGLAVILVVAGLFLYGFVLAARRWRTPGYMLLLLMLATSLILPIWTGRLDYQLALGFPPAALLTAFGLASLLRAARRTLPVPRPAWAAPLVALALLAALSVEFFGRWPTDLQIYRQFNGYLGNLAIYLDRVPDDTPTLICARSLGGATLPDPILMELMMHRPNPNIRFSLCETAIVLTDGGRTQRVAFDFDQSGRTPAALQDWFARLKRKPIEVRGALRTAVYEIEGEVELANAFGKITLAPVSWPPDEPNASDPARLPIRMGDYLTFEGYTMNAAWTLKPGEFIPLVTYWRVDKEQRGDFRLFAHLLRDPNASPVAQNDTLDITAHYLRPRDILVQVTPIQIGYPFPGGEYTLSVGAYRLATQMRLPVFDESGKERGDRIFIGNITVDD